MVDAFTYTKGNEIKTFGSRAEMYDYFCSIGEAVLEGDDCDKFCRHVAVRASAMDVIPKNHGIVTVINKLNNHPEASQKLNEQSMRVVATPKAAFRFE